MATIIWLILMAGLFVLLRVVTKNKETAPQQNSTPAWFVSNPDEELLIVGSRSSWLHVIGFGFILGLSITALLFVFAAIPYFEVSVVLPCMFAVLTIWLGFMYFPSVKTEICITSHRVCGIASYGKRVDLPIDSITAIGTSSYYGIDISTPSGYIHFKFIGNNDAIQSSISKLVSKRQAKNAAPASQNAINMPISNAEELKKYKELLDIGVISQEEFDAKKKQLLGL